MLVLMPFAMALLYPSSELKQSGECVTIVAYEPRLFTSEVATDLRVLSALLVQRSLLASTDEWDGR